MSISTTTNEDTTDAIYEALNTLGKSTGEEEEARKACVFLETLPATALGEALPDLWGVEEARRHRIKPLIITLHILLGACFLGWLVCAYFGWDEPYKAYRFRFWGQNFKDLGILCQFLVCLALWKQNKIRQVQRGIVRFCQTHAPWQLVPLMVEALPFIGQVAPEEVERAVFLSRYRAHLTEMLPLWCRSDAQALTPELRTILFYQLSDVAFRGGDSKRGAQQALPPLSEDAADFCTAVLEALRRPTPSGAARLDKSGRKILEKMTATSASDDSNRRSVQEAAQVTLTQLQK